MRMGSPGEEDLGGGDVAALAEKGGQGLAEGAAHSSRTTAIRLRL